MIREGRIFGNVTVDVENILGFRAETGNPYFEENYLTLYMAGGIQIVVEYAKSNESQFKKDLKFLDLCFGYENVKREYLNESTSK